MRLNPILGLLLVCLVAAPLVGCSRKAEKLVGAGRVIRGPGGLGTTTRVQPTPDRDTYVEPGTADFGDLLIVGNDTLFTARILMAVASWNVPSDTLPGFALGEVWLEVPPDTTFFEGGNVNLHLTGSSWDTTSVAWPGPSLSTLLGSAADNRLTPGPFILPLNPAAYDSMKRWAQAPATVPGFALDRPGQGLLAYKTGGSRFRVAYTHTVSGSPKTDTLSTPVTQDFYLHSPIAPPPTGTESALILGGIYKAGIALHFPLDSVPAKVSIDQALLVLKQIVGPLFNLASSDTLAVIQVRRIESPWIESVTEKAPLGVDNATTASRLLRLAYTAADSTIRITIPGPLIREWASTSSSNQGFYVSLVHRTDPRRKFLIGSRESTARAQLHVTYTDLPPGRF